MSKSFVDVLFAKLGYVKEAQVKPNQYPANSQQPQQSNDKDLLLDPTKDTMATPALQGQPQQLSGNPQKPEVNLQPANTETVQVASPFNPTQVPNTGGQPTSSPNANQMQLRPILDVEEIEQINPTISAQMRRKNIKFVDKELFMKKYNEVVRQAALKKMPLSEYLDEKLK